MYNSIYPVNINYRKYNPYKPQGSSSDALKQDNGHPEQAPQKDSYIPASNQINISQILMDFRNTILAINAPLEVQDEVDAYLNLVDKESNKSNPSKDIIFSNLKNASKISDNFITSALGKKSNVVEGWISTIFRQNINLKANPDEINPDFLLKFPAKKDTASTVSDTTQTKQAEMPQTIVADNKPIQQNVSAKDEIKVTQLENPDTIQAQPDIDVDSTIDTADTKQENIFITNSSQPAVKNAFSANNESDTRAKVLYLQAKKIAKSDSDLTPALNMLNEALGYMSDDSNLNIRAAIHLERGKIFDTYDYIDYALRDYYEATKASDLNLKANAYYKSGSLYDEFKEFNPALDNYLSSVAYSGEANNLTAQSKVLGKISQMYAKRYDVKNAHDYADLAIDAAVDSKNSESIARTYSSLAQNYEYLGEDNKALESYKNAVMAFSRSDESYEQMGYNYSQAAKLMRQLGNEAKAERLQARANQYYQKAQLQIQQQELAS